MRSVITDPLIYNDKIYFQIPAEQKNLQAAVLSGANAYGDYAGRQNVRWDLSSSIYILIVEITISKPINSSIHLYLNQPGVYQNEDRLSFQIHGHDGPHSYRYGYDTGNGYVYLRLYYEYSLELIIIQLVLECKNLSSFLYL